MPMWSIPNISGKFARQLLCLCFLTALVFAAPFRSSVAAQALLVPKPPAVGSAAPAFSLPDSDSKPRTLKEFRGRSVALFFFCGCPWCHRCASQWSLLQRSGSLTPTGPSAPTPITVIVYSGSAGEARAFAAQIGLDTKQTVLLPDPNMLVSETQYHAEPCPRVFVLNEHGVICYTNNHSDDAAQTAPALVIASRALDALRRSGKSADHSRKP